MSASLVNFNAPTTVRKQFDAICHASGRSRTSVLVELMTKYILEEGRRLIDRQNELSSLDEQFQESTGLGGAVDRMDSYHRSVPSPRQTSGDKEFDLPEPIFSDGREVW